MGWTSDKRIIEKKRIEEIPCLLRLVVDVSKKLRVPSTVSSPLSLNSSSISRPAPSQIKTYIYIYIALLLLLLYSLLYIYIYTV